MPEEMTDEDEERHDRGKQGRRRLSYSDLWVPIPSTAQSGQKPVKAVISAIAATTKTPTLRPVLSWTKKPTTARTIPTMILSTLSMPPTFFFMLLLPFFREF
jgi:hypothetical protein